jgi:hypothetical protein
MSPYYASLNKEKVAARKRELMALRPDELRRLPIYTPEPFSAGGRTQELGFYHDKTPRGEDIIVVQCKRQILLGYGHMFAEGFVLDTSDRMRDAEEELLWEYT